MSQHDYDIANQTFPNTRSDLNLALKALASTSSGSSAPSTTFANQLWYDTSANILYIRNEDNDANITIMALDQSNDTVEYFKADSIRTALIEFTDGDDALSIADGGALTTSGNLSIGGSNNELRFYEGGNYVGFEAPALSADKIWVLPTADGSANQTWTTDGSGTLTFGTLPVAGGGTGATTLTANGVLIGNGTGAVTSVDMSTKGKLLLGDGSGNPSLLTVGANGTVLMADSGETTGAKWIAGVGKQTMWIPAGAMYPNTTAGCSDLAQAELSNGPEIKVLDFDASTDEHAQFTVCFPKLWNEGTVTFQPFWTVTGTNTGTVAWGLSAVAFADSGDINTAFGTNVVTTAKAHSGTSNDLDVSAESGAVTIAGSPSTDEMVFFQIMRDVSADNQSGDARLLGIKLLFTTDALSDD